MKNLLEKLTNNPTKFDLLFSYQPIREVILSNLESSQCLQLRTINKRISVEILKTIRTIRLQDKNLNLENVAFFITFLDKELVALKAFKRSAFQLIIWLDQISEFLTTENGQKLVGLLKDTQVPYILITRKQINDVSLSYLSDTNLQKFVLSLYKGQVTELPDSLTQVEIGKLNGFSPKKSNFGNVKLKNLSQLTSLKLYFFEGNLDELPNSLIELYFSSVDHLLLKSQNGLADLNKLREVTFDQFVGALPILPNCLVKLSLSGRADHYLDISHLRLAGLVNLEYLSMQCVTGLPELPANLKVLLLKKIDDLIFLELAELSKLEELVLEEIDVSFIDFPESLKKLKLHNCKDHPKQIPLSVQELEIQGNENHPLDLSNFQLENLCSLKKLKLSHLKLPDLLQELKLYASSGLIHEENKIQEMIRINKKIFALLSNIKNIEIDGVNFSLPFSNHSSDFKQIKQEKISNSRCEIL